jgi:hypothetical protein
VTPEQRASAISIDGERTLAKVLDELIATKASLAEAEQREAALVEALEEIESDFANDNLRPGSFAMRAADHALRALAASRAARGLRP